MTIDEAIANAREKAEEIRENIIYGNSLEPYESYCNAMTGRCAEEHEQLAAWLEELKFLRQWKSDIMDSFCKYDVNSFEELITNTRNKAIDDFVKEICKMCVQSERNGNYRFYSVEVKQAIADLAEQLKAGVDNE